MIHYSKNYRFSLAIRFCCAFLYQNNSKDLDPSSMNQDLWDCFGREKTFIAELSMTDLHICDNFGMISSAL